MRRNLKALGLALAAVFALGAVSASAASAQNGVITAPESFWLEGADETPTKPKLRAFGGVTECHDATYTGGEVDGTVETGEEVHHEDLASGAGSFTLTPTYHECVSGNGFPETVTMNGCDYVIDIGETVGESNDLYDVTADLVCPPNQEVTIDVYLEAPPHSDPPDCVIHIPGGAANENLQGGTLTDEPGSDHLTLGGTVTGITMVMTGPSPCAPNGDIHETAGELDLEATIEGKDKATDGDDVPLSLSH